MSTVINTNSAHVPSAPIIVVVPLSHEQQAANSSKSKNELHKNDETLKDISSRPILEELPKIVRNYYFPPIPSRDVVRILVVAYFRSGSSFLGDILQQNWKTFYHFEPLMYLRNRLRRIKEDDVPEALTLLDNIFRCRFSESMARKYIQKTDIKFFKKNHFLSVACRFVQPQTCFREDFLAYACNSSPVQVMKINRLNMVHVQSFVENNRDLDLRVVHLVRDPRAIISSRKVLKRDCSDTSCWDFRLLCGEMEEDARLFDNLRQSDPNRYFQLRYEDLSVSPEKVARQLYSFLGLPFTNNVHDFLKISTRASGPDLRNPFSTRRNSSQTPFAWKQKLKAADISNIQTGCASILRRLQYDLLPSPSTTTMTTADGH